MFEERDSWHSKNPGTKRYTQWCISFMLSHAQHPLALRLRTPAVSLPASPGQQVLAADTESCLVVLGHTHFVRAALHLQAGVLGWVQG